MPLLWTLLRKFWYIPVILCFAGSTGLYRVAYLNEKAAHVSYVAQRDLAETQAKDAALAAQKAAQDATDARNASIVETLTNVAKERDNALLDAQFSRRLLGAARAAPAGGALPSASDQPGAAGATGDAGDQSLVALLADAGGECRRNTERLWAIQAELAPQLTSAVPR